MPPTGRRQTKRAPLVPEAEQRYPDFEHARENAAIERLDVAAKTKAEKAKGQAKDAERER